VEAATKNRNIKYIEIHTSTHYTWDFISNQKRVTFLATSNLGSIWSPDHTIVALHLCFEPKHDSQMGALGKILFTEASRVGPSPIRNLTIRGWHPVLPDFLSSKTNSLERLTLFCVDFRQENRMELLMNSLEGSGIVLLGLLLCSFERSSEIIFMDFLRAGRLPIRDLGYFSSRVYPLSGAGILEILQCDHLQRFWTKSVNLEAEMDMDHGLDDLRKAIGNCRLSCLGMKTNRLGEFCPAIKTATSHALTHLEIECQFMSESDINKLAELIKDAGCGLKSLELEISDQRNSVDVSLAVLEAMQEDCTNLRELFLNHYKPRSSLDPENLNLLVERIANLKSLTVLGLSGIGEKCIDASVEGKLSVSLTKNWSLESLKLTMLPLDITDPVPKLDPTPVSPALREEIASFMARNKRKKKIFSPEMEEVDRLACIDMLASLWELPDWASLSLWLLQRVPHHFF
jgi:hypothetical protein